MKAPAHYILMIFLDQEYINIPGTQSPLYPVRRPANHVSSQARSSKIFLRESWEAPADDRGVQDFNNNKDLAEQGSSFSLF